MSESETIRCPFDDRTKTEKHGCTHKVGRDRASVELKSKIIAVHQARSCHRIVAPSAQTAKLLVKKNSVETPRERAGYCKVRVFGVWREDQAGRMPRTWHNPQSHNSLMERPRP